MRIKESGMSLSALYGATLLSGLGTGVLLVMANWLLLKLYESSTIIGILTAASYFACFLALPVLSGWLDRYHRRHLLQRIYVVTGVIQLVLAGFALAGGTELILLAVSVILSVLVRMLDQMARLAIAQQLVPKARYREVSRHLEILRQGITLVSGVIVAVLIDKIALHHLLILDAATYLCGGMLLCLVQCQHQGGAATKSQSKLTELREGLSFLKQNHYFFSLMVVTLVPYVLVLSQNAIHPAHVEEVLQLDGDAYALIGVVFGVGAVAAPVLLTWIHRLGLLREKVIFVGFVGYLSASCIILLWPGFYATCIAMLLFSASHSVVRIERLAFMMEYAPVSLVGRISGVFEFIGLISVVLVTSMIGVIADQFSVNSAWAAMLVIILVGAVLFSLSCYRAQRSLITSAAGEDTEC